MESNIPDNEKEWILEAINHLKHRKARPDLSRISLRMKRKWDVNFSQTKKLLESLVESGIVVKAVYKNNTSYRDVSKWKRGRVGGQIQNSNKMLKRFVRAIETMETRKGRGATCDEIEQFLKSHLEEKCFLSGNALRDALEKEASNGYLGKIYDSEIFSDRYFIKESLVKVLNKHGHSADHNEDTTSDQQGESKSVLETDCLKLKSSIMAAIRNTESSKGEGSSLHLIKQYLANSCEMALDNESLLGLMEQYTAKSYLKQKDDLYIVADSLSNKDNSKPDEAENQDGEISEENLQIKVLHGLSLVPKSMASRGLNSNKPSSLRVLPDFTAGTDDRKANNPSLGPSRPPSKRKRIMKDHGPDFEIEMPTKTKSRGQDSFKDSVYPTPTNSPSSERSECTFDQSLNAAAKKKRGRPKKSKLDADAIKSEISFEDDTSQQALPSSESSRPTYTTKIEPEDNSRSASPAYDDVSTWSAQQVADYFKEKGYTEEAQSMLENELDGSALGLLRRSDVVGPPMGGILKVKKLGTALKLFRDIRDLLYQGHSDNYVDPYEDRPFSRL